MKYAILFAVIAASLVGCSGGNTEGGETVASPPRALVEKSFKPGVGTPAPNEHK